MFNLSGSLYKPGNLFGSYLISYIYFLFLGVTFYSLLWKLLSWRGFKIEGSDEYNLFGSNVIFFFLNYILHTKFVCLACDT